MLLFPLPPARNKENIEMETMQTLDRDGNSVKPGQRWEQCKPWIETGTLQTLDRDGNNVNPGQRRELCKSWIEMDTL